VTSLNPPQTSPRPANIGISWRLSGGLKSNGGSAISGSDYATLSMISGSGSQNIS
jgi:hypothetical protein